VIGVDRRGKHQLLRLDDGRILHAHFRMSGDWATGSDAVTARYPRATIHLDDGSAIVLDDPRALSSIELKPAGEDPLPGVGPDANSPDLDRNFLFDRLRRRRSSIKVALLDQAILSGIGNIYASESLWRARIDPRRSSDALSKAEARRLTGAIVAVLEKASGSRYAEGEGRFNVYDREGKPCRRCRTPIARIPQGGRSTYFCPNCQK
jgi:formamidopyrimidine-DNA glycosylase